MKKLTSLLVAALASVTLICGCGVAEEAPKPPAGNAPDPFDFQGNTVNPEVVIDGRDDDELWQDESVTHTKFSTCEVSILRRTNAIYLYFKVKDVTPYSYVNQGAADEVTHSDSIEFYLNSDLSLVETILNSNLAAEDPRPKTNCYQVNLGRDGRTRIMSGSSTIWMEWAAMYTFEVREGFGSEEDYYYVEAMLPAAQMNINADSDIGIAFGLVDRTSEENQDLEAYYTWYGMTVGGTFIEPQDPSKYLVLKAGGGDLQTYSEYLAGKA